ncbi:Hsp70 family protein [Actinoplanes sp. NPDC051861]|uniref:Hsp70 family protein n=1 Tax=Actinoplanes sp. NPDC051861 TaxID=3155170 RepID=UPI0034494E70
MIDAAIVIGCSGYEDPDIADLRWAHRDAERFAATLTGIGTPAENIALLHDGLAPDSLPTRAAIVRRLATLERRGPRTVALYFSGHGFRSPEDETDFLIPADCVAGALPDTSIRFDLVLRMLRKSGAQNILLFLDACRAAVEGGKSAGTEVTPIDVAAIRPPGMVSFCSCKPGERSYESDDLRAGVFTEALCLALGESGRCTTIYELDRYLVRTLPDISAACRKPWQHSYTRVEPLGIQSLSVVSDRKRNEWSSSGKVGQERRAQRLAATAVPLSEAPMLAIDFGTSYSAASVCLPDGTVKLIPSPQGRTLVPSVVTFTEDLDYYAGWAALAAERDHPLSSVREVKRVLGTDAAVEIQGRSLSPELIAGLVIRHLKNNAEDFLGVPVGKCIASYPANFGIAQNNVLQKAFQLAGLELDRMHGEPNMAALTVENGSDWEGTVLVVDLGGGTFDVALVEIGDDVYEIKSVAGNNDVGGLDFDTALAEHAMKQLRGLHISGELRPLLRQEAERAKRSLGDHESTTIRLPDIEDGHGGFRDHEVVVDRATFRAVTEHLTTLIVETIGFALDDAAIRSTDLDLILLAGQGAKIFTVREELAKLFPQVAVESTYQETAVVLGLARQSRMVSGVEGSALLLDLTHRGLGFRYTPAGETEHGLRAAKDGRGGSELVTLVERSSTIPAMRSEVVSFAGRADEPLRIEVVERSRLSAVRPGAAPEHLTIGELEVPAAGSEVDVAIEFHLDHRNVFSVLVEDMTNRHLHDVQLSHLYHRRGSMKFVQRVRRVLDGWTVHPLRQIGEPPDPAAAMSLETVDLDADMEAIRNGTYARDVSPGEAFLAGGHMAVHAGRPEEAAEFYLSAVSAFLPIRLSRGDAETAIECLTRTASSLPSHAEFAARLERAVDVPVQKAESLTAAAADAVRLLRVGTYQG